MSGIWSLKAQFWVVILVTFNVCLAKCVQTSIPFIALEFYFCPSVYDHLQCTEIKVVKGFRHCTPWIPFCLHWYLCTRTVSSRPEWWSPCSWSLSLWGRGFFWLLIAGEWTQNAQVEQSSPFPWEVGLPVGSTPCPSLSPMEMPGGMCVSSGTQFEKFSCPLI